jgi:hypothetical protein
LGDMGGDFVVVVVCLGGVSTFFSTRDGRSGDLGVGFTEVSSEA